MQDAIKCIVKIASRVLFAHTPTQRGNNPSRNTIVVTRGIDWAASDVIDMVG